MHRHIYIYIYICSIIFTDALYVYIYIHIYRVFDDMRIDEEIDQKMHSRCIGCNLSRIVKLGAGSTPTAEHQARQLFSCP